MDLLAFFTAGPSGRAHEVVRMGNTCESGSGDLSSAQETARQEWRNLCFTLERAQGDNLVRNCKDKYEFAKTYQCFGRNLDQTIDDVQKAASQGNYSFFSERGIASTTMTPSLAIAMLKDFRGAITSKKIMLAAHFRSRYGENIDEFVGTPHHGSRLLMAEGVDDADATVQLAQWAAGIGTSDQISTLRAEVEQIKAQLADLTAKVEQLLLRCPSD